MSESYERNWSTERARPGLRRVLVILLALVALLVIVAGGSLIRPQTAAGGAAPVALVGRTSLVCTVTPPPADTPADQPLAATAVTAVGVRGTPAGAGSTAGSTAGTLTGTPLDSAQESLEVTEPGKGVQVSAVKASVLLQGQGAMATASSGVVFAAATSGPDAGLSGAPCLAPGTQHWFTGVGAGDVDRTELVLSNPDDAQAEVDLRYFGRQGRVAVAGSPGVLIEAHRTRTVSLATLNSADGPFSVEIQASTGRVSAVAQRARTVELKPAGMDWQLPSSTPATTTVIGGIPGGTGKRDLVVTNPGTDRATVGVQVLGLQGAFAPTGAATLEVPPESTASVDLAPGLAGEAAGVRLTSDLPVTAAVVSTSDRAGASSDFAVESATAPLVGSGVSALATTNTADSELVLSNGGDTDAQVSFEVLSLDGVSLRSDEVLLAANSSATRRLTSAAPSYVVVRVPAGSGVVGGVSLTQPDGDAAGLATIPLTSPDLAGRAPDPVPDPAAGR